MEIILDVVQISRQARAEHHTVIARRRFRQNVRLVLPPPENASVFRISIGGHQFVPAERRATKFMNDRGHATVKITFKLHRVRIAEITREFHNRRIVRPLPVAEPDFVAAEMDVLTGKQITHFAQNVFQKFIRLRLRGMERVAGPVARAAFADFWIGHRRRRRVAGHINFGNDDDVPLPRVVHDFADIFLRIKLRRGVGVLEVAARTNLRELRITFDLNAPAIVVGEMPMKAVQLQAGHQVENFLHRLLAVKMIRFIEEKSAPLKSRRIRDTHRWQRDGICGRR